MTTFQKVIKYLSIALAVFLTVSIFGAIGIFGIFFEDDGTSKDMKNYTVSQDITELKVDINAADFTIKSSDSFSVESNLKYLTVEEKNGCLIFSETRDFAINYTDPVISLYIPKDLVFEQVDITTGAGRLTIDTLVADNLKMELGAGEVNIEKLIANAETKIEGGAGRISINDGILNNLDMDMGVGELNFKGILTHESEINLGVGKTKIALIGTKEEYRIHLDKGIGSVRVDGKDMSDGSIYGSGNNEINIDGGVGAIEVAFSKAVD